ncbi:MAG: FMN-binding protein [Sphaerochaetaceae bacterium]
MKYISRVGITLAVICFVAALSLALVNAITSPRIAAYEQQVIQDALMEVAGRYELGSEEIQSDDQAISGIHSLVDQDGSFAGYILQLQGIGYGGVMSVMASYTLDGTVIAARLLANSETPGLGKKAENPSYMEKFTTTGGSEPVPVKKEMLPKSEADAIGGATVTFSGIAKSIAYGSDYVKALGGTL